MNAKTRIVISLFLIAGLNSSINGQVLKLDSCYIWAVANYPLIRQYDLIDKAKDYSIQNAGNSYLPQMSIQGIAGYVFGSGQSESELIGIAQVNQLIWDGGATKVQKRSIAAQTETERANLDVSMYDVRSRVSQLFLGVLLIDEQLRLAEQHEKILANNAVRVKKLNENGLAFQIDLDEIAVEQRKLNQRRMEYRYVRNGYLQMLSLLIGRELGHEAALEKPALSELSSRLPMSRPEIKVFSAQRAMAEVEDAKRKADLMPRIGVTAAGVMIEPGVSLGPMSLSSLGMVGLSASWKINGLYRNTIQKQMNDLSLERIALNQRNFLFNNEIQTAQTRANIEKQKAVLEDDAEIVELRGRIREGYQVKYDNGMASLLDLLDAAEKENEARTQMALHEMQLLMTYYEYRSQTGN